MDAKRYTYRVQWSDEDGEFIGLCAEFPSLSWLAADQAEALRGIVRVVTDVLDDLRKQDEALPEPISTRRHSDAMTLRADFLAVLDAVPDAPPDPGDELPSR